MIKEYRFVIINSSLLFVIATILEMTLHECAHFIAAWQLHAANLSLHHNYVNYGDENLTTSKRIIIASAGPFISLLIGIAFQFICSRMQPRNLFFLFNLYMSVFGYIGFFGYLMIAPMFAGGDTGFVMRATGFPMWCIILIAIAGGFILYLLMKSLTKYFVEMGSEELIINPDQRKKFIHALMQYPLYIGIIITTVLNLPVPVLLSLIAPVFSPFTLMWSYGDALIKPYTSQHFNKNFKQLNSFSPMLIFVLFVVIAVNRYLVHGIYA
ncbi:MAG: hypothetical protein JWN78_152 [Bacteroidota bacterium]|nr:hypothetical protein [Bacteroidota bacterium]